jgi:hypothetical protein
VLEFPDVALQGALAEPVGDAGREAAAGRRWRSANLARK